MAPDLNAPSWWNAIYASYDDYRRDLEPILPPLVPVGPFPIPRDVFLVSSWLTPGGQSGLYARLAIASRDSALAPSVRDQIWSQIQNQATSAGFGDGGGFGGSFGYRAERESSMQIIIPGAYRVSIEAASGGQVVTNVVGVQNAAGTALGAAEAVQTAWKVASGPLTLLGAQYVLTGFRALDLSSANGDIAFVSDTAPGTGASAQLATNGACALVKWNGGTRSRSSRGRLYFGPLRESQIESDGRRLLATQQTAITAAFEAFRASLASSGYPLVVISPTLQDTFPVTQVAVETVIATQRRRIRS